MRAVRPRVTAAADVPAPPAGFVMDDVPTRLEDHIAAVPAENATAAPAGGVEVRFPALGQAQEQAAKPVIIDAATLKAVASDSSGSIDAGAAGNHLRRMADQAL